MVEASDMNRQALDDVARRHGFSSDAIASMFKSLTAGLTGMAQFSHPEFGGYGQWMRGGMTMIANSNPALRARVDAVCNELAELIAASPGPAPPAPPGDGKGRTLHEFGQPDSSGSQDGLRYAFFAETRRLVVERDGVSSVYDTLDHRIDGISQQQSQGRSLTFRSQHGPVDLASLPVVSGTTEPPPAARPPKTAPASTKPGTAAEIAAALEGIAALHAKGILTDDEFSRKKAELLARL